MPMFHTYVDWTSEEVPRPFYVGKGNEYRTRNPERNQKHKHVRNKFGHRREIIFSSQDERECLKLEIQLIQEYHTFYLDDCADKDIACNFTKGGDGATGWVPTDSQKKNISDGIKKAHSANPEYAKEIARLAKIRMNDPKFVAKISNVIKDAFKKMPKEKLQEMRNKSSLKNKGRISPQRGERSWRTTLNDELVRQIRSDYLQMRENYKKVEVVKNLAEKYQQGYNAIFKIISGATWKHVEV